MRVIKIVKNFKQMSVLMLNYQPFSFTLFCAYEVEEGIKKGVT